MKTLGFRQWGDSRLQPILFLHGFLGCADDWEPIARRFSDKAWCIALDLPGHGTSTDLDADTYTLDGAIQAIHSLLNTLEVDRPLLVGYSMGGRLALGYALRYTDDVSGLFLESTSPGLESKTDQAARLQVDIQRARLIRADFERFLRAWFDLPLFASLRERGDLVEQLLARRRSQDAGEVSRAVEGLSVGSYPAQWDNLASLQFPISIVGGTLDPTYDRIGRAIAERVRLGEYSAVADAGHNVHLEQPAAFVDALEVFLARNE
jgi:2-succinyl-6-hydroxy-2,4-cyclohexadiene-1-carboxylate synthase